MQSGTDEIGVRLRRNAVEKVEHIMRRPGPACDDVSAGCTSLSGQSGGGSMSLGDGEGQPM